MRNLVLVCCAAPFLAAASPVRAHAILMDSQPAALAILPPGSTHFTLRFNSRIDRARSRLELRHVAGKQDGPALPTALMPVVAQPAPPDTLATDLSLSSGEWVLRWQVLAVDGHITRGEVPFTVRKP